MGQSLALAAGLCTALKFSGSFGLQAKGDGPVSILLADCTHTGDLRAHARVEAEKLASLLATNAAPNASDLLGTGYLAFTVDQGANLARQQGIVSITGKTLDEMALYYLNASEQLQCQIHLGCEQTSRGWRAGALVLEKIAGEGGVTPVLDEEAREENWRTASALAATLTDAELLDDELPGEKLLYRLFHTEGVAIDRARSLSYGCRCSRAKLASILEGFPEEDLDYMSLDGEIIMNCEFCNYEFRFPRASICGKDASSRPSP
jgi:molecular chaperone Hsp33